VNRVFLLLLVSIPVTACASSLPEERRDYILSRPHGFIEITINDSIIPDVIQRYDEDKKLAKPLECGLSAQANSEPFFSQAVYPDGSESPYNVASGFRFPVPVGSHRLVIAYEGCRATDKGEVATINVSTDIHVQNNVVYEIVFNNGQIANVIEKANDEVTLKQVLEAVKK